MYVHTHLFSYILCYVVNLFFHIEEILILDLIISCI